jgi:hypothetical protein
MREVIRLMGKHSSALIDVDLVKSALERIDEVVSESVAKVQSLVNDDHIRLGVDRIVIGDGGGHDWIVIFLAERVEKGSHRNSPIVLVVQD